MLPFVSFIDLTLEGHHKTA